MHPSYQTVADVIGMSRDTVMDAVKELEANGYLVVHGTKGGSARNTNEFEFHVKPGGGPATGGGLATGGELATGGAVVDRSGEGATEGVEQPPHELSLELSRTTAKTFVEVDSLDGDELRKYWRSEGVMEPYRVHRGRHYELSGSDPALAHIKKKASQ